MAGGPVIAIYGHSTRSAASAIDADRAADLVADTCERTQEKTRPALLCLFRQGRKQAAETFNPSSYVSPGPLHGMFSLDRRPFTELSYENLLADQYAVVGSPGTVTKRLTEMHDRLGGYGQIIGRFAIGPTARQQTRRSTEPLPLRCCRRCGNWVPSDDGG